MPRNALARNREPHARAERSHAVEKNMAGDSDGVNQGENSKRRRFKIAEALALALEHWNKRARENCEEYGEKWQPDERMGERTMIFDDSERIARKDLDDNIRVGENRSESRGERCNASIAFRKISLAEKCARDSVG